MAISFAPVTDMTKYRVHNVELGQSLGWTWKQESTFGDLFTKGNQTITVTWQANQMGSMVHMVGTKVKESFGATKGQKLQRLSNALGKPMALQGAGSKYKGLKLAELEAKGAKLFKIIGEPAPKPAPKGKPAPAPKGPTAAERQATKDAAHLLELA